MILPEAKAAMMSHLDDIAGSLLAMAAYSAAFTNVEGMAAINQKVREGIASLGELPEMIHKLPEQ
jgi:hypothetical protein